MTESKPIHIVLTGGGTGGHVYPAIAIADALKSVHPNAAFLFVGAEGKMEMERVPGAGYEIVGLPVAGFHRKINLRNLWRNFFFPFKLFASMQKAKRVLKDFAPDVVIGTGGYASGPLMRAAQGKQIPTVIQEQNSYPGVTNKILAKGASLICVAYENMEQFFPADKIQLLGNPIRKDLTTLDEKRNEALEYFGLDPAKPVIYLTGGSLGARTLNRATAAAESLFKANPDVQILWQCGKIYEEEFRATGSAKLDQVQLFPFAERMDLAYAAADIIIARAGALTVSELCTVAKPVILVPSPNVAEDHQTKNARALSDREAALLIPDADAVSELWSTAFELISDKEKMADLASRIRPLGKPDAAGQIANAVLDLIK